MNSVFKAPARLNIFKSDLDYHVVLARVDFPVPSRTGAPGPVTERR
jgi:hypothetical protein